jgi:ADP-ribose pyrophosphatase YjhB (NUDIX family)
MKTYQFCNNCGKNGHLYHTCKKPITSSGIICFKKNTNTNTNKYLIICRKDTLGYVDFVRGKYPIYNKVYIQNLFNEMTIQEKHFLLENEFDEIWKKLWGDFSGMQYANEEKISKNKFNSIKEGIFLFNKSTFNLKSLIKNSKTNWTEPEWGFPKGRRNYLENDLTCAIREFKEETGINEIGFKIIKNILPYDEIFMGSNYKSYKHKYYLAVIDKKNLNLNNYQKSEVSNIKLATLEECLELIRPYNLEKIEIIKKIDKMLNNYSIIS